MLQEEGDLPGRLGVDHVDLLAARVVQQLVVGSNVQNLAADDGFIIFYAYRTLNRAFVLSTNTSQRYAADLLDIAVR